jgi:hypothetical protein
MKTKQILVGRFGLAKSLSLTLSHIIFDSVHHLL